METLVSNINLYSNFLHMLFQHIVFVKSKIIKLLKNIFIYSMYTRCPIIDGLTLVS